MTEIRKTNTRQNLIRDIAKTVPATDTNSQPPAPRQDKLKDLISTMQVREMFRNALQEHADSFLASIVDLYANDRTLQFCNPNEVLMEAFKAATLKLPINRQLGFAFIIPFKDAKSGRTVPQFQLGYKGYIQLCMRTGAYRHIHAGPIYDGEFVSEDRLTGELDLSGKRTGDAIVGFSAYLETINGFSKAIYWTVDRMNIHAKRYSKSFGTGGSPWVMNYEAMGTKTVLRNLLSKYGILSIELQRAYLSEIGDIADEQLSDTADTPEVAGLSDTQEPDGRGTPAAASDAT